MVKCAITLCQNYNDRKSKESPIKFHRFPNNIVLKSEWLKLCGLTEYTNTDNLRVCSVHFTEDLQHTLQCRLLGTSSNVFRKSKCGCRIPEGGLPSLNLPFSRRKMLLENRKAKVAAAQKEKDRKELVEELLRTSSSIPGSSAKVTYKNIAPTVHFDPLATAEPPQKKQVENPMTGAPPAKKARPQKILPLLQQRVKILPKPPPCVSVTPAGNRTLLCLPKSSAVTSNTVNKQSNLQMKIETNTMPVQPVSAISHMSVQSVNSDGMQSNPQSFVLTVLPTDTLSLFPTSTVNIEIPSDVLTDVSKDPEVQEMEHVDIKQFQSIPSTSTDSMDTKVTTEIPQHFLMDDQEEEVLEFKDEEQMEVFSESENDEAETLRELDSPVDIQTPGTSTESALQGLCRVCATPSEEMVYIFGPEGKSQNLQYKINLCLPILVTELDSLPLCVCKVCLLRLELSYKLASTCEIADNKLKILQQTIISDTEQTPSTFYCKFEKTEGNEDSAFSNVKIKPRGIKTVQKVASNKLPILCSYCDLLLCTTHDAVLHYLKLHQKSACEFCFNLFDNNEDLIKHLNSSHIYSCNYCTFKIIGLGETLLKNHINSVHNKQQIRINKISKQLKKIVPKVVDKSGVHKCKLCYLLFSSKYNLKNHYISVHKKFICIGCFKEFSSRNELETHEFDEFHEVLCKYCNKEFSTSRGLHSHIAMSHRDTLPLVHKEEQAEYECKICYTIYVNRRNLRRHYFKKHSCFSCSLCDSYFNTKDEYEVHSKEENHFTCETCEEDFNNSDIYKLHVEKHKMGSDFECQSCNNKVFSSKSALKLHIRYVHLNEQFKYSCPHCEKLCKTPRILKLHIRRHDSEKKIKCDQCSKRFFDYSGLKTHSLVHTGEKKFICEQCGKKFTHQRNLAAHIKGVHTTCWIFTCNICKHTQNNEEDIVTHCKIHLSDHSEISYTKTSPYYCETCTKYFANKLYHVNHIRHHSILEKTGRTEILKPFECNVCLKKFISKQMLKRHFGSHLAIKPFMCTYCKRGFLEDKDLEIHIRVHTNERPFICTYCNKGFHKKSNLLVHRKNVHEEVRKLACPYCEKLFKRHHHLTVHIRTHTHEKPYICDICDRPFSQQADLVRHKQRHKSILKTPRKKVMKVLEQVDLTPLPVPLPKVIEIFKL